VRAKAVLVEAARVLPDMTTTLCPVTRHTYRTPALARHCPALSARSSYRLSAAGYAPSYTQSDLDSAQTQVAREALEHLLAGHEPYPAVVLDRWGDVALANRAIGPLLDGVDPALLDPPINVYRLSLHPDGLPPRIHNRTEWTAHLGHRLTRLARLTGDPRLSDLLAEIRTYPGVAAALDDYHEPVTAELLLTLQLAHQDGDLRLHSTVTNFGSPHDVTLAELTVESFFPADTHTPAPHAPGRGRAHRRSKRRAVEHPAAGEAGA